MILAADKKHATSTPGMRALKQSIHVDAIRVSQLSSQSAGAAKHPVLIRGAKGSPVRELQDFLKAYGTYSGGDTDGVFGMKTEAAVRTFQRKESINPAMGIVGEKTWARIIQISFAKASTNKISVAPASIEDVVLSSDIAENGSASLPSTSFASTTPIIYAVVSLQNSLQETEIGYIRSYRGVYVDSKVSHPSRNDLKYMHFQWSLKPGATRPVGDYAISFYINGKKSKIVNFTLY